MKQIRLALAAAALAAAVAACDTGRLTAPQHTTARSRAVADQTPGGSPAAAPAAAAPETTPPAPSDTTGKGQIMGSGY
ncbi:MAG: hypothetical protein JO306_10920 [Gemmatimonadetes bacterium]|nr:hypothetical protein [Gemmatimonadota bacterium]